jgi:hypothetical protein
VCCSFLTVRYRKYPPPDHPKNNFIEIPAPRWTAYEAKRFGIEMPDNVPMVNQERTYTSPIWYTP